MMPITVTRSTHCAGLVGLGTRHQLAAFQLGHGLHLATQRGGGLKHPARNRSTCAIQAACAVAVQQVVDLHQAHVHQSPQQHDIVLLRRVVLHQRFQAHDAFGQAPDRIGIHAQKCPSSVST